MKKILIIIMVVISLTGCGTKETKESITDALKFKEEYESLNEEDNYRILEIEEKNPFIYASASEIIEMMDREETFVVYFGFASCPWCRSIISSFIKVTADLGIETVYYVDVKEIRDVKIIDDEGNIVTSKEGTSDYLQLLERLNDVLEPYLLTDADGNEIDTGEKRIYAPSIIAVVDGEVKEMTDGLSSEQITSNMELTTEMEQESYDKIKCTIECTINNQKICSAKTKC